jgi:hypothetical protein
MALSDNPLCFIQKFSEEQLKTGTASNSGFCPCDRFYPHWTPKTPPKDFQERYL